MDNFVNLFLYWAPVLGHLVIRKKWYDFKWLISSQKNEILHTNFNKYSWNCLNVCSITNLKIFVGEGIPTVFIAVAGRSNGLGPVLSGNASWPVINCPPVKADWGPEDIWSSLRLPSGMYF